MQAYLTQTYYKSLIKKHCKRSIHKRSKLLATIEQSDNWLLIGVSWSYCEMHFYNQGFVTKFWKITHMGMHETIRISEFGGFLFRAKNYFWIISRVFLLFKALRMVWNHQQLYLHYKACDLIILDVKCTHMGDFPKLDLVCTLIYEKSVINVGHNRQSFSIA